jgi:Tfp pilus assembly protein PilV
MRISKTQAFSLVEVSISLGIVAFCIPAIIGLLPIGLSSNQSASEQVSGAHLLSAVATDLRATPPVDAATSQQFGISIPALPIMDKRTVPPIYLTADGQVSSTVQGARYLLTVNFLPSSHGSGEKSATLADLKVSWPAMAASGKATGSVEAFVALNRN